MRRFANRHPVILCLLIAAVAFGLAPLSEAAFPSSPVGSVSDLSPEELEPPSEREQIISAIKTPESLFWALAIILSAIVLSVFG